MDGLRLVLSWLTVLPVTARTVDERSCATAISLAPLAGALIGLFGAAGSWALTALGVPALLAGLLVVAMWALVTRGLHLDGLADTADGLGCYGSPDRALRVMRDGNAGPFAVVTLIFVLGSQVIALGTLADSGRWPALVLACAVGRAGFVLCCRHGVPSARPDGMGALVASSQPVWRVVSWWGVLFVFGMFAVPGGLGMIAVGLSAATLLAGSRHVHRRLGGITGDVLGASCEIGTTLVLVVCCAA